MSAHGVRTAQLVKTYGNPTFPCATQHCRSANIKVQRTTGWTLTTLRTDRPQPSRTAALRGRPGSLQCKHTGTVRLYRLYTFANAIGCVRDSFMYHRKLHKTKTSIEPAEAGQLVPCDKVKQGSILRVAWATKPSATTESARSGGVRATALCMGIYASQVLLRQCTVQSYKGCSDSYK